MRTLWRSIVSTIFWSYERGSWPYDLMVVAILVFVLGSPRSWFHDQVQLRPGSSGSVEFVSEDRNNHTRMYRLDASVLSLPKRTPKPTPELERETHDILGRTVNELKDRTFQIVRIDPALSSEGSVAYYDVTVRL